MRLPPLGTARRARRCAGHPVSYDSWRAAGRGVSAYQYGSARWRSVVQSTTVSAVMLTIRRTVADGVRMFTGLATPSRIGPSVTPEPDAAFSRLNEMFA